MPNKRAVKRGAENDNKGSAPLSIRERRRKENPLARPLALLKFLRNFGTELLFPARCVVCQKPLGLSSSGPICSQCWIKVRAIQGPICSKCGYPLEAEIGDVPAEELYCTSCRSRSPVFTRARSVFYYEGVLRQLVHYFKYQGKVHVGKRLAQSLVDYCRSESFFSHVECVVPVPLGIKKLRHREFNQSFILGKATGKFLEVPIYPLALSREKEPVSQMKLSRQERMRNVRGAFKVRKKKQIYGKKILLVDDVFTTGATVNECSRILLQNGAKKVRVLTLARTILS